MNRIVVYCSQYGSAEKYAKELSRRLSCECVRYEDVRDINAYETLVYIGSLYAGGVQGMKKTLKKLNNASGKNILIATVGLADPTDNENVEHIRANMRSQLPAEVYENANIFHLRGAIDYSRLNFLHKKMMGLLCKKAASLPEEQKNAEVRAMLETYNKQVDFIDLGSLEPIVEAV